MKYKRKPIIVDAVKWLGHNFPEVQKFGKENGIDIQMFDNKLFISNLDGTTTAYLGDYIVNENSLNSGFYTIRPDMFELMYEKME